MGIGSEVSGVGWGWKERNRETCRHADIHIDRQRQQL